MTAKPHAIAPSRGGAIVEPPAYVVVLARVLVESALRDIRDDAAANDNLSTMVDKEDR